MQDVLPELHCSTSWACAWAAATPPSAWVDPAEGLAVQHAAMGLRVLLVGMCMGSSNTTIGMGRSSRVISSTACSNGPEGTAREHVHGQQQHLHRRG